MRRTWSILWCSGDNPPKSQRYIIVSANANGVPRKGAKIVQKGGKRGAKNCERREQKSCKKGGFGGTVNAENLFINDGGNGEAI